MSNCTNHKKHLFPVAALQLTVFLLSSFSQAALASNPPPVQFYFVPLPEDQVLKSLKSIYPQDICDSEHFGPVDPVNTYVSIVTAFNNTVLYYDHWEDGYEADISNPISSTTEIWGDNNPANGFPPGYPHDVLKAGDTIVLNNSVATATRQSVIDVDGGDKIAAANPVSFTRAAWADQTETLLAGAVELFEVDKWGTLFELPVGVNIDSDSNSMFEYTGASIMASEAHTIVDMDKDGDGVFEDTEVLHQGESHLIDGGLKSSAVIRANKNIQVTLITGDICASYETRWYTIFPKDQWSDSYYSPVSTNSDDGTGLFVYNPNKQPIHVSLETPDGVKETVKIDFQGTEKIVVPSGSGGHLYSRNGSPFLALAAIDSDDKQSSIHDWGFPLIPERMLTQQVLVGWGAGRDPLSAVHPNENSSPIWVTPVVPQGNGPVKVCADYNGDNIGNYTDAHGNQYDSFFYLRELENAKIYDTDGDQTGMIVYICDESESKLAAAWGQDPNKASRGEPAVDMGTTIPPLRSFYVLKDNVVSMDYNGDGKANPNETITYTIEIFNVSRVPVPDMRLIDDLPEYTIYVPGSALLNDGTSIIPISDFGNTPYPFDEGGIILGDIPVNGKFTVTFKVRLESFLPAGVTEIYNRAVAQALGEEDDDDTTTDTSNAPAILLNKTLYEGQDGGMGCPGSDQIQVRSETPITYCFEITNTGDTYLNELHLVDNDLGIELSDDTLLGPGESIMLHYETISDKDLVNLAVVTGNPVDDLGNDHEDEEDVSDDDTATLVEIPTGHIFGHVFLDENGKDCWDNQEPPLFGIEVVITEKDGKNTTVVTDATGRYELKVLAGPIKADVVESSLPKGLRQTCGDDPSYKTVARDAWTNMGDDGFQPFGKVFGNVFEDTNGKNGKDLNEGPLPFKVNIIVTDFMGEPHETSTDGQGNYEIDVPAGRMEHQYVGAPTMSTVVETELLKKYKYTFGKNPNTVNVQWGERVDIGLDGYQPRANVHGFVFKDLNGNKRYDANLPDGSGAEPPFPGVTVILTDSYDGEYKVTTDSNGNYTENVAEGYVTADVQEEEWLAIGYEYTAGTDPTTVYAPRIIKTDLGDDGLQPLGRVWGYVFENLKDDDVFDKANEPGIPNVKVDVTDRWNGQWTVTTNDSGYYEVKVPIGKTISNIDETTIPKGYEQTYGEDPSEAEATLGSLTHIGDDGYTPYAEVYGNVFIDLEPIHEKDDNDRPMVGIKVTLEDPSDKDKTVETDSNGDYRAKVQAGKVVARVQDADLLEAGWRQTYGENPTTKMIDSGSVTHIGDDGYNPPPCELEVDTFCSVTKVVSGNDCHGGVKQMVLAYTGEGCQASDNNQSKDKCKTDFGGNGGMGELVDVDLIKDTSAVRPPDFTSREGHIILTARGNGVFAKETKLQIRGDKGGQTVSIITSCDEPLRVGDTFGGLRLVELTSTNGGTVTEGSYGDTSECSVQLFTPECDRGATDRSFTFLYTGNRCAASTNPQGGKFNCGYGSSDVELGEFVSASAPDTDAKVTVEQDSQGRFLITLASRNGDKFPSQTLFKVTGKNGVQWLDIHTSCSQNFAVGDLYGAFKVVGINGEQMGVTVEYIYEIENIGKADVSDLLVSDDQLGFIECVDELRAGDFTTCRATATYDDEGTYVNAVEVSGVEQYDRECSATASASVEVIGPPQPPFECIKPINALTMIWKGSQTVRVEAFKGAEGSQSLGVKTVAPDEEVTFTGFAGSSNDVEWVIYDQSSGRRLGKSMFHVSCSDDDMDGQEDCGKAEGNAKNNGSALLNLWELEGIQAQGRTLDCSDL